MNSGESEPKAAIKEELPSDKAQIPAGLKEFGELIESRLGNSGGGGVFINLGDLKWLVEQPVGFGVGGLGNMQQLTLAEVGRAAVAEMGVWRRWCWQALVVGYCYL
ncbi:hypothetical protein SESBI_38080 [Sesbania bispinosa]|nr:hypothetical protein SESBI_38080 [Sesbania bispinosa]